MLLFYKQYSDSGAPLLILHGLFGHQGNWAGPARELADGFSVYGLDARNHGSSEHTKLMTYSDMAEDVRETMDELGIEQADFIGHSMGGKTAMQFALNWPDRVKRLLVVDIAPVAYKGGPDPVLNALLKLDLAAISSRQEADILLEADIPEKAIRDFLLTNLRRDGNGFRWRMNLMAIDKCYSDLRGALNGDSPFPGPTLFIKGELSGYLQPAYKEQTIRLFPEAQIKTVSGAGHWVHSEKPQQFIKLARRFLLD